MAAILAPCPNPKIPWNERHSPMTPFWFEELAPPRAHIWDRWSKDASKPEYFIVEVSFVLIVSWTYHRLDGAHCSSSCRFTSNRGASTKYSSIPCFSHRRSSSLERCLLKERAEEASGWRQRTLIVALVAFKRESSGVLRWWSEYNVCRAEHIINFTT